MINKYPRNDVLALKGKGLFCFDFEEDDFGEK